MSRIPLSTTLEHVFNRSKELLRGASGLLGSVPNVFRLLSTSPETLDGFLALSSALNRGQLDTPMRARIALMVAETNQSQYCLAAHSYMGAHIARLSSAEIALNRHGRSSDDRADAALQFAQRLITERGRVQHRDVERVRSAGFSNAEVVEMVGHVAMNTFTNHLNEAFDTDIDFPKATPLPG